MQNWNWKTFRLSRRSWRKVARSGLLLLGGGNIV